MAAPLGRPVTAAELAQHASEGSEGGCWIAFYGQVYDITAFLAEHPGGKKVLLKDAGRDGTKAYSKVHGRSMLARLPPTALVGHLPPAEQELLQRQEAAGATASPAGSSGTANTRIELHHVLNLYDFELAAEQRMDKHGYGYYASAANDEVTKRANEAAFSRAWLRPRVLVNVESVDTSCRLLGFPSAFPVFISPAAMAGLAHADAEPALARAAGEHGIIQVVANMASRDLEEITSVRKEGQIQWFQVYVNPDRQKSEAMVRRAVAAGCRALVVTVDTAVLGRRERDMRNKVTDDSALAVVERTNVTTRTAGVAAALGRIQDPSLSWADLAWLRSISKLPIVLKGIQTGEDAVTAARHGVEAIIVSNHGGRNLDHCRPTLDILAEVMAALEAAGLRHRMEVYLDGGVRRGTDVYKALALGARAVGIGRPALFSLTFGQEGVEKCLQLLRDEVVMCMQLMGVRNLAEIGPRDIVFQPAVAHWAGDQGAQLLPHQVASKL